MEKNKLIGSWRIDPTDTQSIQFYGNIKMSFTEDGDLIYLIEEKNKLQQINMTYEISGNRLITDQQAHPSKEETNFEILPDGRLKLLMNGQESIYVKEL